MSNETSVMISDICIDRLSAYLDSLPEIKGKARKIKEERKQKEKN